MAVVLLAAGGEPVRQALRYERAAVFAGEYWRLLTGHLVHSSAAHLGLNLAGVALIAGLFPAHYALWQWLVILLCSLVCIDAGFVFYQPQLEWYVGLSGILHGLLAGGAVAWWKRETKPLALAMTLIFGAKLLWEQTHGALPFSGDMRVIVDAHIYGALGGAVAGLILHLGLQGWPPRPRSL